MKTKLLTIALVASTCVVSNAAVSITGAALTGMGTQAPVGSLVLFIIDTDGDGFLGSSFNGDLLAANDPGLNPQGLAVNTTFGGDTILARGAVTSNGAVPGNLGNASSIPTSFENLAATQGKNFALVWFPTLTAASTEAAAGVKYGIVSGSDWTLPSTNANSLSYNTNLTDTANFLRLTGGASVANDRFTTGTGAVFTIIPETSTALLGALGALGLLRRRR